MRTSRRAATRRLPALLLAFGVVTGGVAVGVATEAAPAVAHVAEVPVNPAPTVSIDKTAYPTTGIVEYTGANFAPGEPVTITVEGPMSGTFDGEADADGYVGGTLQIVEVDDDGVTTGNTLDWTPGAYTLTLSQDLPMVEDDCTAPADSGDPTPTPTESATPTPSPPSPPATADANGDDGTPQPDGSADDGADSGTPGAAGDGSDVTDAATGASGSAPEREIRTTICTPAGPLSATTTFSVAEPDGAAAQPSDRGDQLVPTGSDDHLGIAGLGLLVLAAGGAALAGQRRLSRPR